MERIDEPSSSQLNINDLPQEILVYIFSFINIRERIKIERVCKNWRYIGTTLQWKIKEFKFNYCSDGDLTDYMLEEILKRCGKCVLVIDIIYCHRLTTKACRIIGKHCPNLRSVKFGRKCLTDIDLEYFSSKCTKLKEAVLIGWRYGEDGLRSFLKNCQELEVLRIKNNPNISGHCFEFISPKVKELTLTHCKRLTPEGFLKLGKCKCIEHLELSYCESLDTAILQEVLKQNCNSLKHLVLNGLFEDVGPQINFQELPFELLIKLSISFQNNYYIKDDTLLKIAHNCKNLRTLDVSLTDITDVGLQHLTSCPLLTTLDVSYIHTITDESIISLAMVGKLESLAIQANKKITDNACKMLAVHCTKLKHLNLRWCSRITDATAHSFIYAMEQRNDGHRKLEIITNCTGISLGEDVFIIENNFPRGSGMLASIKAFRIKNL